MSLELQASGRKFTQISVIKPSIIGARDTVLVDSPRKPLIVGGFTALAALGAFVLWASLMAVSSGAIAPGKIIVEGNRKAIQHQVGGPVGQVFVREGQKVEKGQPLLELDLTEIRAEFNVLSSSRLLTLAVLARLRSEAANASQITWPPELTQPMNPQILAIRDQEQTVFKTRLTSHLGQIALQQQQIEGSTRQIEGLRGKHASTLKQLQSVQDELTSLAPLIAQGLVTRPRITTLERTGAGLQGDLEVIQNSIASEESNISKSKGQIDLLQQQRKESIAKELSEAEARWADVEPRLAAAKERLARATLVAPEAGYVFNLAVFSRGSVITPGQTVLEIVPANDALVLEIEINPRDSEQVHPGQSVVIHLLTEAQRYQSVIHGTLLKVSADRVEELSTHRSFYRGIVKVDERDLARAGAVMSPGTPAEAVVETGERTILAFLFDPIFRITDFAMREK